MFNNTSALFVYFTIIQSVLTNHVQNILMFPALYGTTTCRGCTCIFVFARTTITTFISSIFYSIFRCVFKMTKKEKDYSNWVKLYLPQLKELSKQKIFNPQNLSLKNKMKYFYTILMSNKKLKQIKF